MVDAVRKRQRRRKYVSVIELRRRIELDDIGPTVSHLTEALQSGDLHPNDFSIKELFEELVNGGTDIVKSWDPRRRGVQTINLVEAGNAVDTSMFSNITGQIVYSALLEAFDDELFIGEQVARIVPTQFDGEKIPGIGKIGDQAQVVDEGKPFGTVGINEEFIETPVTTKRGMIIPVTKEAIFFDRTGLIMDRVAQVGQQLGINREKRILDVVVGQENNYKRNGIANNTYLTSGAYVNTKTSNALVDWTDIENAELLLDGITDPNTGEPIIIIPNTIIVPSALKYTAKRIVSATEIRFGETDNATGTQTLAGNPVGDYKILTNRFVKQRTSSDSEWFLGDPMRAFAYMENWPITVIQAPNNSEAEFTSDIVVRFKASERGAMSVHEPRVMIRNTA